MRVFEGRHYQVLAHEGIPVEVTATHPDLPNVVLDQMGHPSVYEATDQIAEVRKRTEEMEARLVREWREAKQRVRDLTSDLIDLGILGAVSARELQRRKEREQHERNQDVAADAG